MTKNFERRPYLEGIYNSPAVKRPITRARATGKSTELAMTESEARLIVALSRAMHLLDALVVSPAARVALNDIVAGLGDDFNKDLVRRAEKRLAGHDQAPG